MKKVVVVCDECKSENVYLIEERKTKKTGFIWGDSLYNIQKKYKCRDCEKEFVETEEG